MTLTGLSLSTARVTFGAEQGEKATFTVSNLSGPAPLGTVSIFATGNGNSTFLCSGTLPPLLGSLTFSAGSCGLGSSPLSPDSHFQRRCGQRRLHLRAAGTHGNPVTVT